MSSINSRSLLKPLRLKSGTSLVKWAISGSPCSSGRGMDWKKRAVVNQNVLKAGLEFFDFLRIDFPDES